jgi:hypothetical protein
MHLLSVDHDKVFFFRLGYHHCCPPLMRWNNTWNQIYLNEIGNDNIDQSVDVIN